MELEEFVKAVLSQIVAGVRGAQEVAGVGAFVVPAGIGGHDFAGHPRVSMKAYLTSTIVDFDIAVTAEETSSTSGGGGLKVAGIGASLERESTARDARVNRIQFAVPILLPESQKQWHLELKDD